MIQLYQSDSFFYKRKPRTNANYSYLKSTNQSIIKLVLECVMALAYETVFPIYTYRILHVSLAAAVTTYDLKT